MLNAKKKMARGRGRVIDQQPDLALKPGSPFPDCREGLTDRLVTCREPAGCDQTPEAGTNTKSNITKPLESIVFGGAVKPANSKRDPNVNSLKHKRPL